MIILQKLKGSSCVVNAARHNKRFIPNELGLGSHIAVERSCLNFCLAGPPTPKEIDELAKARMRSEGVMKLRTDAVRCIEIVCSLPVHGTVDVTAYFQTVLGWASNRFGSQNILSLDVHLDEGAPHCHILVLPLVDGCMNGSALMGSRETLQAHRRSFDIEVMRSFGLALNPPQMKGAQRRAAALSILKSLEGCKDSIFQSSCFARVSALIRSDPAPWLFELGLPVPEMQPRQRPPKNKTMVQIFTSKGKGPKRHED